jgi:DNA-binding NarL/FixJ family response regulator
MTPSLTRRESQVLELLAAGCRHTEVAERLGVSPHTVSSHAKNIYRKLGVRSAIAAVSLAVDLGLIRGCYERQRPS